MLSDAHLIKFVEGLYQEYVNKNFTKIEDALTDDVTAMLIMVGNGSLFGSHLAGKKPVWDLMDKMFEEFRSMTISDINITAHSPFGVARATAAWNEGLPMKYLEFYRIRDDNGSPKIENIVGLIEIKGAEDANFQKILSLFLQGEPESSPSKDTAEQFFDEWNACFRNKGGNIAKYFDEKLQWAEIFMEGGKMANFTHNVGRDEFLSGLAKSWKTYKDEGTPTTFYQYPLLVIHGRASVDGSPSEKLSFMRLFKVDTSEDRSINVIRTVLITNKEGEEEGLF